MTALRSPFSTGFTDTAADDLTYLLRVLGDPTRLKVLALLHAYRTLTIVELVNRIGTLKQPTISHHVKVLAEAGLVTKRSVGVNVECTLAYGAVQRVAAAIDPSAGLKRGGQ